MIRAKDLATQRSQCLEPEALAVSACSTREEELELSAKSTRDMGRSASGKTLRTTAVVESLDTRHDVQPCLEASCLCVNVSPPNSDAASDWLSLGR